MARVTPEARKKADIAQLTAVACAHPERRYRLWTLRSWDSTDQQYTLRLVGHGMSWRRASNLDIELESALGKKLEATWKRNKYDAFVGHRSLRSVIRELTGEDIKAKIDAARAEQALREAERRSAMARNTLAQSLRATLDALHAPGALDVRLQQVTLDSEMRALLGKLTREDVRIAEVVAYTPYGRPRGDD